MESAETDQSVLDATVQTFCQYVATDLTMLAALNDQEPDAALLGSLQETDFPHGLGLKLVSTTGLHALDFMQRALTALPHKLDQVSLDELAADYASIYLNHGIHASPLESVWIDEENLACQDSMFQVRSWYEQYGLYTENWRIRPDDHLVLQLQFLAHLSARCQTNTCLQDAARFMDEHLLRWLMTFAERVAGRCNTAYFAAVAMLTGAYCEELRDLLALILFEPRPTPTEVDERMKTKRKPEAVPVQFMPGVGPAV